jgi:hypothetical protein
MVDQASNASRCYQLARAKSATTVRLPKPAGSRRRTGVEALYHRFAVGPMAWK